MWLLFYFFNYFIVQLQLSAFQFPLKRKLLLLPVSCVPGFKQSPRKAQQGESTDGPEHCRQVTQVAWGWSQKCRHLVSISDLRDQAPVPDPTGAERAGARPAPCRTNAVLPVRLQSTGGGRAPGQGLGAGPALHLSSSADPESKAESKAEGQGQAGRMLVAES